MEWTDEAIVLGLRRQGESHAVLEAMTRERGRHLGLVRGARSQKLAAALQTGNRLRLVWRARLDEHLGIYAVEPIGFRAAGYMESPIALLAAQTLAALLRLVSERDPHPDLYAALDEVLDRIGDPVETGELVVRFELMLLEGLGIGLDLSTCAVTGATRDLAWVSPKTGRAASRAAGAPFADRLLPLPAFLAPADGSNHPPPDGADLAAGFRLTGHFLARHAAQERGRDLPETRDRLLALIQRDAGGG